LFKNGESQTKVECLIEYGGPDGEMGASMRYLVQRYSMKDKKVIGTLTDIGVSVMKLRMRVVLRKEVRGENTFC
jgi:Mn-containing catalase